MVDEKAVSFQRGNVDDLQHVLEELLTHPEKVEKYKAESQDYICEKYHWDKVVDDTLAVYTDVIERKKKKHAEKQ